MTRAVAIGAGVAAAVVLGAVAVVLARAAGGDDAPSGFPRQLRATGTLQPRILPFGDLLTARIDVTLDRRRVDPGSVAIQARFPPWSRAEPPEVSRSDAGPLSHLRTSFVLRCLTFACVPGRDTLALDFGPARVTYTERTGRGRTIQRASDVAWPRVVVHSRIAPADLAAVNPWRSDVSALPAPSYRAAPGLVVAVLVAGSALLALAGTLLANAGRPRRVSEVEPEPAPEPEPLVAPLERALELLETAAGPNGAADQRRSLELVADVLAKRGDDDGLAPAARELGWSSSPPSIEAMQRLAARVRATLEDELRELEAERRRQQEVAAATATAAEAARRA